MINVLIFICYHDRILSRNMVGEVTIGILITAD